MSPRLAPPTTFVVAHTDICRWLGTARYSAAWHIDSSTGVVFGADWRPPRRRHTLRIASHYLRLRVFGWNDVDAQRRVYHRRQVPGGNGHREVGLGPTPELAAAIFSVRVGLRAVRLKPSERAYSSYMGRLRHGRSRN
jgi:hypothetical protein